jgi:thioredoxin reductase (NADPH)
MTDGRIGSRPPVYERREGLPGMLDCLIIGGGPAGLTAATYLARYRRIARVVDFGASRARQIPLSHNYPGFNGIAGPDLLRRLRDQAETFGADIRSGQVTDLIEQDGGFVATLGQERIEARSVLMATGLIDKSPAIANEHRSHSAIRYCPVCDGYEAIDRSIGVLGPLQAAGKKALFLRTYSRNIAVFATDEDGPSETGNALRSAGIKTYVSDGRISVCGENAVRVNVEGGGCREVAFLYPALGCAVRSDMALRLGAVGDDVGCLKVDGHQQTSVVGLYAAGDVVTDLHQLSVAIGHAAVAATAIHNQLPPNRA